MRSGSDPTKTISSRRWILSYLFKEKFIFIPSLIALFITAALSLAFPYFLKELIGTPVDSITEAVPPAEILGRVDHVIVQLLIALLLQATIGYFRVQGFIRAGESALNNLRKDIFSHILKLPTPFFEEQATGALSNRVSSDLTVVRETLLTTIPQTVRHTVILIGGLIFIFFASWKLSLILLSCVPVVVLLIAIFGRKVRQHSKNAQQSLEEASSVIEEAVQNIPEVKAFTNESFEKQRYSSALARFFGMTARGANARGAFLSFIIFVLFGTIAFVVWQGARMYSAGDINWENFFAFIIFSIFVGASLGSFPEIISQLQQTSGATERLRTLMNEAPERSSGRTDITISGTITATDLAFSYPSRPKIQTLQNLNFSIPAGKRIAVVGPSGAGKSTLFSLLLGFHESSKGQLCFDGIPVSDIALNTLRQQIAVVSQETSLFGNSIKENIQYGKIDSSLEEIRQAAKEANAHEFIEELPNGYETIIGPRGTKLSGGQRQRLAIARAILANPKILLLDEATSSLDTESERLVTEALGKLMTGRTSLVIAHRLSTVKDADEILVMVKGTIVEKGTHEELMRQQGTYRFLAETQFSDT